MSIKKLFIDICEKAGKMTTPMKGSIALATLLVISAMLIYTATVYFDFGYFPGSSRPDQKEPSHTPSQSTSIQTGAVATTNTTSESYVDQNQPIETATPPTPAETTWPSTADEILPDETTDATTSADESTVPEDISISANETILSETTDSDQSSAVTTTTVETTTGNTTTAETTAALTQDEIDRLIREDNILINSDSQADAMLTLQSDVLDYLGMRSLNMGLYYYDLETSAFFAINPYRQFRSASTAKVFAVMAMYEAVNKGDLTLDQEVTYLDDDYEAGSGILRHQDEIDTYTLRELAEFAMLHSDNIAYHMIMRTLGRSEAYDYYESIIGHDTNRTVTQMSAADATALLQHLYTSDNPYFPLMIDDLRRTDFRQALPRYLPEGSVSNKIGFLNSRGLFHDIAIVHAEQPYILAVYSQDIFDNFADNPENLLADLSKLIYKNR